MKVVMGITAAFAFFILLGTAGALDCNTITLTQGMIRVAIFLPVFTVSALIAIKRK